MSLRVQSPVTPRQLPEHPDFRRIIVDDVRGNTPAADLGDGLRGLDLLANLGWLETFAVECMAVQSVDGLPRLAQLRRLELGRRSGAYR